MVAAPLVAQQPEIPNSRPAEAWPAPRELDKARLSAAGIAVLREGPLTLVTDLPLSAEINELPRIIAAAVPLFAERFDIPAKRTAEWRVQAYLIKDLAKFESFGLLPEGREFAMDSPSVRRRGSSSSRAITSAGTCCCTRRRIVSWR